MKYVTLALLLALLHLLLRGLQNVRTYPLCLVRRAWSSYLMKQCRVLIENSVLGPYVQLELSKDVEPWYSLFEVFCTSRRNIRNRMI